MSPRRRYAEADGADGADGVVDADGVVGPDYFDTAPKPPLRWGLPLIAAVTAVLITAAIVVSALMLARSESDRRAAVNEAAVLSYAREFMTMYTSLDPFNANDYADRVLAEGTGEFAEHFQDRLNEILVQVARAEPTTGTVLDAGLQRWNDDGSADVLIATKITTTAPDGTSTVESGSRWIATTIKEGQRWKISNLVQVI